MSLGHEGGGWGSGILGLREERRVTPCTTDSVCLFCLCYPSRNPNVLCSGSLPSEPPLQSGACISSMVSFNDTLYAVGTWLSPTVFVALMLGGCQWECLLPMSALHLSLSLAPFLAAGEGPTNLTLTGL